MSTIDEQIREIEEQIRRTQKNKATEHHIGLLKAKLAKLRRKKIEDQFSAKSSGGKGFDVKKSGDGTVVLIGFPSCGKSTLISKITNKESRVGDYAFTTTEAIPGIMEHRGTKIQIIDLPGIIEGASLGKGRGREILAVARSADLILLMLDPFESEYYYNVIMNELYKVGIRPGKERPNIKIKKTDRGGIALSVLHPLTKITEHTFKSILREYKVMNAIVTVKCDPTIDEVIDFLQENRVYPKLLIVINKIDLISKEELNKLKEQFPDALFVSALNGENLNRLKDAIVEKLDLMTIYLKKQGQKADFDEPMVIKRGSTIKDVCRKIHRKFVENFRYAVITGPSAKYPNQRFGLDHVVEEGDIITIVVKKF
ncbi:MAG: GTP-binding protein [Thermoproteota archaeon]|nr:MAG: GTP-binding protein [Candidatus Korarchaeota archaeon]